MKMITAIAGILVLVGGAYATGGCRSCSQHEREDSHENPNLPDEVSEEGYQFAMPSHIGGETVTPSQQKDYFSDIDETMKHQCGKYIIVSMKSDEEFGGDIVLCGYLGMQPASLKCGQLTSNETWTKHSICGRRFKLEHLGCSLNTVEHAEDKCLRDPIHATVCEPWPCPKTVKLMTFDEWPRHDDYFIHDPADFYEYMFSTQYGFTWKLDSINSNPRFGTMLSDAVLDNYYNNEDPHEAPLYNVFSGSNFAVGAIASTHEWDETGGHLGFSRSSSFSLISAFLSVDLDMVTSTITVEGYYSSNYTGTPVTYSIPLNQHAVSTSTNSAPCPVFVIFPHSFRNLRSVKMTAVSYFHDDDNTTLQRVDDLVTMDNVTVCIDCKDKNEIYLPREATTDFDLSASRDVVRRGRRFRNRHEDESVTVLDQSLDVVDQSVIADDDTSVPQSVDI